MSLKPILTTYTRKVIEKWPQVARIREYFTPCLACTHIYTNVCCTTVRTAVSCIHTPLHLVQRFPLVYRGQGGRIAMCSDCRLPTAFLFSSHGNLTRPRLLLCYNTLCYADCFLVFVTWQSHTTKILLPCYAVLCCAVTELNHEARSDRTCTADNYGMIIERYDSWAVSTLSCRGTPLQFFTAPRQQGQHDAAAQSRVMYDTYDTMIRIMQYQYSESASSTAVA